MTFAIPATVYNIKYNFTFIFFPTYLPNFSKKKSVNQGIKLEWPYKKCHEEEICVDISLFSVFSYRACAIASEVIKIGQI